MKFKKYINKFYPEEILKLNSEGKNIIRLDKSSILR